MSTKQSLVPFRSHIKKLYEFFDLITTLGARLEMAERQRLFTENETGVKRNMKIYLQSVHQSTYYRKLLIKVNLLIDKTKAKTGKEVLYRRNDALLNEIAKLTEELFKDMKWSTGADINVAMKKKLQILTSDFFIALPIYKSEKGSLTRKMLQDEIFDKIDSADVTKALIKLKKIGILVKSQEEDDKRYGIYSFNFEAFNILDDYTSKMTEVIRSHSN